jgi:hypothetical protein
MKLYTATEKDGTVLAWAGTQAEARAAKKEKNAATWQEVEVPTNKTELLEFLKLNATGKKILLP